MLYQAGELALTIAVKLVRKTVPVYQPKTQQTSYQSPFTKNEYLQQMLRVFQQQVAYRYLLAGRWYASAENMTLVRALGYHFLFALESSRTVALSEADRAQGRFQAGQSLVFPIRNPCAFICVPSSRRCSQLSKSLQTKTVARACCI